MSDITKLFETEVYTIETYAKEQLARKTIKLFSDSQASLNALESSYCNSKLSYGDGNKILLD